MNKVYVCEKETYDDGREPHCVCSTLEKAQELMRNDYDCYIKHNPNACIEWYSGENRKWGWYDTDRQGGFYVTEKEVI